MRNLCYMFLVLIGLTMFAACNDGETYAEQKEKERNAINKYLADSAVKVITEAEFYAQDTMTDVSKNEFVLISSNGVYMQIINKGCGEKIKSGETTTVLCRYTERNLLTDSIQSTNDVLYFSSMVDKMTVTNNSGTFTASFLSGSVMYMLYSSASVPAGWLTPLSYVKVGRPQNDTEEIARVRIIVPSDYGHSYASQGVYPCLYDITYERGR